MPRVLLILALVLTAFWVYTIVDCSVQPANRHRGVSKPIWILIVVLLPVLVLADLHEVAPFHGLVLGL